MTPRLLLCVGAFPMLEEPLLDGLPVWRLAPEPWLFLPLDDVCRVDTILIKKFEVFTDVEVLELLRI